MRWLFIILLAGCSGKLRPDPLIAINLGYPTAEIFACERKWNGLASCAAFEKTRFSFGVQGYYKGTIVVDSKNCNIHESVRYSGHEEKVFGAEITKSCVIDIVVSPEYPGDITAAPLKGRIYLSAMKPEEDYFVQSSKVKASVDGSLFLPIKRDQSTISMRGCGSIYDRTIKVTSPTFELRASTLIVIDKPRQCIFEGVILNQTRVAWQVWVYDQKFSQIPDPVVTLKGHTLTVDADPIVGVISLNNKYKMSNKAEFDFNPAKDHVLRLLTAGGRNLIGVWEGSKWEWIR